MPTDDEVIAVLQITEDRLYTLEQAEEMMSALESRVPEDSPLHNALENLRNMLDEIEETKK